MRQKALYDGSTIQLPNAQGELEEIGGLSAPGNVERLVAIKAFIYVTDGGTEIGVRLEEKARGSAYWFGYKRRGGRLYKKYICEAYALDPYVLDDAARRLLTVDCKLGRKVP